MTQPLATLLSADEAEVARVMTICNACRYCEGFCAVFPAMTRRLEFPKDDVHYLANLCHNCGACLHACQYAPPHEFAVNVPRAMARVRLQTYSDYAWPQAFAGLYRRNALALALALAGGLALRLLDRPDERLGADPGADAHDERDEGAAAVASAGGAVGPEDCGGAEQAASPVVPEHDAGGECQGDEDRADQRRSGFKGSCRGGRFHGIRWRRGRGLACN